MALTTPTTLSSAVAQSDVSVVVASATGITAGMYGLVDQEVVQVSKSYSSGTTIPVQRGVDGSVQTTHKSGASILFFLGSDEALAGQNFVQFPKVRGRDRLSYTAAGAITLPTPGNDMLAEINGTGALAMTLANPTVDMSGSILIIAGNGKAAHTVTWTTGSSGIGNGGAAVDVATFAAGGLQCLIFVAVGGFWCLSVLAGTLTNITVTMS